jgi:hypothetical protein
LSRIALTRSLMLIAPSTLSDARFGPPALP